MEGRENFSRKRLSILNALQGTKVHPTAEWVYRQLKPRYPDLSLGTVYRNLRKLCSAGKAASVGVINGQERFDGCVKPHAHFFCTECGGVMDLPEPLLGEETFSTLSRRTGYDVRSASVILRGICPACKEKESAQ